ncbi:MAG: hypothetical protein U0176_13705 [Bacteroidia bacterium]
MASTSLPVGSSKSGKWIPIAIGAAIVLALIPLVWWWMNRTSNEFLIATQPITLDGKPLQCNLLERTNSNEVRGLNSNPNTQMETGHVHLGYRLELYDSAAGKSLSQIEFKSPVSNIQSDPRMVIVPGGRIWLVSTSLSTDDDKRGFILQFVATGTKLQQAEFSLDEVFRIRDLDGTKVILSEGPSNSGGYIDPIRGGIFLDLVTGNVVDARVRP